MDLPSISELIRRRNTGHLRIGAVRTYRGEDLSKALARLGLKYQGESCREIEGTEAKRILAAAFHQDLAYGSKLMGIEEAERFASFVVDAIFPPRPKFLTNVERLDPSAMFRGSYGGSFHGTEATFSVGVIAVAPSVTACVWVEDED